MYIRGEGQRIEWNANAYPVEVFCEKYFYGPLVVAFNENTNSHKLVDFTVDDMKMFANRIKDDMLQSVSVFMSRPPWERNAFRCLWTSQKNLKRKKLPRPGNSRKKIRMVGQSSTSLINRKKRKLHEKWPLINLTSKLMGKIYLSSDPRKPETRISPTYSDERRSKQSGRPVPAGWKASNLNLKRKNWRSLYHHLRPKSSEANSLILKSRKKKMGDRCLETIYKSNKRQSTWSSISSRRPSWWNLKPMREPQRWTWTSTSTASQILISWMRNLLRPNHMWHQPCPTHSNLETSTMIRPKFGSRTRSSIVTLDKVNASSAASHVFWSSH